MERKRNEKERLNDKKKIKGEMKKTLFVLLASMVFFTCAAPEKEIKKETIFYPMPPQQPRLQFLVSITGEEDFAKQQNDFLNIQTREASYSKKIARPYDIFATRGKIYISDRTFKKILIIDLEKKKFDFISSYSPQSYYESVGIWVTEDEYKYIADFNKKKILVFDKNNKFLRTYGEFDQFDKPVDVAVFKNKIYVCDMNKHMLIVIDRNTGKTIQEIGGIGAKEGYFYKPSHVIVDIEGNVYVNDSFNFRIQKFDQNGKFMKTFGYHGDTLGALARPKGLDLDKEGHLYVVDAAFENVQIFDNKTTDLLFFFGGFGLEQGKMYLPNGIYIDYHNVNYFKKYADKDFRLEYLVYVGNMWGPRKLNVYGFGKWTGAPFPVKSKTIEDNKTQ
ncbi:MAG: hypothetical protein KAI96_05730 [Thermodesulfovibrionia bacterium]|nr:hypothetical protein [Thermodesulfovibrionia bacterium]MCK5512286.1 hypothetical protein [Thermodesulfovibrionia bacterium]